MTIEIEQTEVVMLSMKVSKYNKYNWVQERNFVVTQDNIYIFKHKSKLNIGLKCFRIKKIRTDILPAGNHKKFAHQFT